MFGRKSTAASLVFGDLNYGFVLTLSGKTGIDRYLKGSREIRLGDGSPSGHHIIMSALDQRRVMIQLGSKPGEVDGVILEYATPASPYWEKVVRVLNEGGSQMIVGIPGMARRAADGTVGIFVITGSDDARSPHGEPTVDLTRTTSTEIGAALDRVGMVWSYDNDGDVRFRTRSTQQPWIDPLFYEFDSTSVNFRVHGQFLVGRPVSQDDGRSNWEVTLDHGYEPTTIAQKVVTVYFMPRPGGVLLQIHAAAAVKIQARPMEIQIIPGSHQVARIEQKYPGFVGKEQTGPNGSKQFWMMGAVGGKQVDDSKFLDLLHEVTSVGLAMFDGPFTGWMKVPGT